MQQVPKIVILCSTKTTTFHGLAVFFVYDPYVRPMIVEPGDLNREVPVAEYFHEQTDEELTEKELKQMEANDQAI
nr:hypothetical protein [Tanacetum cinerariifolium]